MDRKMPGMDGWETARQIRQQQHSNGAPVVIMVTAFGSDILEDRPLSDRNLLNGLLVKPVTASMLFDAFMDASSRTMRFAAKQAAKRLSGLRILVVEDAPLNRQVAQELLSAEGAIVDVAESGAAGVQKTLTVAPPYD